MQVIAAAARERCFHAGEWIVHAGEAPSAIYVVVHGAGEVLSASGSHRLATIYASDVIGEIAFLDGAPRSAGVRAIEDTTVLEISAMDIAALPNGERISLALKAALGAELATRVRHNNTKFAAAMDREIDSLRERRSFGLFYIYSLLILGIGMVTYALVLEDVWGADVRSTAFSWQYLTLMVAPTLGLAALLGVPPGMMGLTRKRLGRSLVEGTVAGVVLVALIGALAATFAAQSGTAVRVSIDPATTLAYVAHSFLQELLARGFILTSFQRFLDDRRGTLSVILSASMFSVFHVHFGLMALAVTFVGGLLFGALFLRHRNIAGVTIAHSLAGTAGFAFGIL